MKLLLLTIFVCAINAETVTLDCEYPVTSQKLDICKLAHIEGDYSNKDVVLNPRIGNPSEIKIKHVHLGRIPASIISDHPNIKELKIKNGSIYSLDGVSQLKQLEELELPHNNLSEISEIHLSNPLLKEIDLEHNEIETIHPNAFQNTPVLKVLDLEGNKIRSLYRSVIVDTLETLDLKDNLLESIENLFNGNSNIRRIYLARNHIQKITSNTFTGCSSLFKLDLSKNEITSVEEGAFDHLESLQLLDLARNKLKSFQMTINNEYMGNLFINDNKLTSFSVKLGVPELKRKFTLEAQRNTLASVDIPKIFYNKLKLHSNPLTQLPLTNIKSVEFFYLDNIDLSNMDLAPLSDIKDLITISLNNTNIGTDTFKSLLQHPSVKLIDVSYNPKLADFDFGQLSTGGAPNLEGLIMNYCGVAQVNIEIVKNTFPKLNHFKVHGKNIGYEEAKTIEKAVSQRGTPEF